jgi:hypothetical protein
LVLSGLPPGILFVNSDMIYTISRSGTSISILIYLDYYLNLWCQWVTMVFSTVSTSSGFQNLRVTLSLFAKSTLTPSIMLHVRTYAYPLIAARPDTYTCLQNYLLIRLWWHVQIQ